MSNDGTPIFYRIYTDADRKIHVRRVQFEWTPTYCWWIIPTVEINTSMKEIAIYFFCLSAYITWGKNK